MSGAFAAHSRAAYALVLTPRTSRPRGAFGGSGHTMGRPLTSLSLFAPTRGIFSEAQTARHDRHNDEFVECAGAHVQRLVAGGCSLDLDIVCLDPLPPAVFADPAKVPGMTLLLGRLDAVSVSNGKCSTASFTARSVLSHFDTYGSTGGITREAHGRKIRPRAEGTLELPPTAAGHRSSPTRRPCGPLR